jgi:hypothetical protein
MIAETWEERLERSHSLLSDTLAPGREYYGMITRTTPRSRVYLYIDLFGSSLFLVVGDTVRTFHGFN